VYVNSLQIIDKTVQDAKFIRIKDIIVFSTFKFRIAGEGRIGWAVIIEPEEKANVDRTRRAFLLTDGNLTPHG